VDSAGRSLSREERRNPTGALVRAECTAAEAGEAAMCRRAISAMPLPPVGVPAA
jgi:hypothetical protein